jgi:hypothetical protein
MNSRHSGVPVIFTSLVALTFLIISIIGGLIISSTKDYNDHWRSTSCSLVYCNYIQNISVYNITYCNDFCVSGIVNNYINCNNTIIPCYYNVKVNVPQLGKPDVLDNSGLAIFQIILSIGFFLPLCYVIIQLIRKNNREEYIELR